MLKKLSIFLFLSIFLTGCNLQKEEDVVTFSSWGSITETQITKEIINNFEKENPDIKIRFLHFPQNYFQKIHLLFASHQEPDIIFINNLYLPLYKDFLLELNSIDFSQEKYYKKSLEALSIDNKLYAIPRDISNLVFYYNKDLLGSEIKKELTFDEFIEIISKIQSNEIFPISLERDYFWTVPFSLTKNNEAQGLDIYLRLQKLYAPKPQDIGSYTMAQLFLNKKIVFYLSGRWMYPKIKESANFNWGIIAFPGITRADASGWAISKNCKQKEKAIKFIKYISNENNTSLYTSTGLITPARIDSANKMENNEVFIKSIENSKSIKIDKRYRQKADFYNKKLFD